MPYIADRRAQIGDEKRVGGVAEKPHEQNTMKMQSRAGRVANQPTGQSEMDSASFGEIRRFYENRAYQKTKDNRDLF